MKEEKKVPRARTYVYANVNAEKEIDDGVLTRGRACLNIVEFTVNARLSNNVFVTML